MKGNLILKFKKYKLAIRAFKNALLYVNKENNPSLWVELMINKGDSYQEQIRRDIGN